MIFTYKTLNWHVHLMRIYGWAQHLPDQKKPFVKDELGKLIAEWPTEVVKRQKKDNRKVRYLIFGLIPPQSGIFVSLVFPSPAEVRLLVALRLGTKLSGECLFHYLLCRATFAFFENC
jgi:hypothetical protein